MADDRVLRVGDVQLATGPQVRAFKDETQRVEKELAASPTTRAYVVTDETERLSSPEG